MLSTLKDALPAIVLATGALGTAAFGIVEALKRYPFVGEAGFDALLKILGPIFDTLKVAYGPDAQTMLRAQYRGEQDELKKTMRQGVRIGLTPQNAAPIARSLDSIDAAQLIAAAEAVRAGTELPPPLRNALPRFEVAADARIDASVALAQDRYEHSAQLCAMAVAMVIAIAVGVILNRVLESVLIGLTAVPLAPIAKDVASALKSAAEALRART